MKKLVFLTGAGMSVESGFKTFRGNDVSIVVRVARRADLGEFSMQVDHVLGSRLLVQVIHVLCNHRYVEILLQLLDKQMSLVRLSGIELMAQHIIEVSH